MNNDLNSIGLDKKPSDTTVVVAMSGGVDSSTVGRHDEERRFQCDRYNIKAL
jgi:predicted PP-loop superfamily ATPase